MMNEKVDFYFNRGRWQTEVQHLRMVLHDTKEIGYQLNEDLKWGVPCYTFQDRNIVLMHVFKEYCALLFFKGVLLKDPKGILINKRRMFRPHAKSVSQAFRKSLSLNLN